MLMKLYIISTIYQSTGLAVDDAEIDNNLWKYETI